MARVEGGCCLLSPDVMRLCPLRDDLRPGLPAPSPPLEDFPAAPLCYRLGSLHTLHGLQRGARFSVRRSPPYFIDLYRINAYPCPKVAIASRHRLGFHLWPVGKSINPFEFFALGAINGSRSLTHNPLVRGSTPRGPTKQTLMPQGF